MTTQILESVERGIASELLDIASIYEIYLGSIDAWITFFDQAAEATKELGRSVSHDGDDELVLSPREIIRVSIDFVAPSAGGLLTEIRRLEAASEFSLLDLYGRLERLEIRRIEQADRKGLFLLTSKAIEDHEETLTNDETNGV